MAMKNGCDIFVRAMVVGVVLFIINAEAGELFCYIFLFAEIHCYQDGLSNEKRGEKRPPCLTQEHFVVRS